MIILGDEQLGFRTLFVKNGEMLRVKLENLEISTNRDCFIIQLGGIESIILERKNNH